MQLENILLGLSLFGQILAAAIAISLIKRTKYNASWILISFGLMIMVFYRLLEILPLIDPELSGDIYPIEKWAGLIMSISFLIGILYVRKIFYFMNKSESLRRQLDKEKLITVIKAEERERLHFSKELHDGLGPLLSVSKMLVSGLKDASSDVERREIQDNLEKSIDEAILGVRELSSNISPYILNSFGLIEAIGSFINKFKSGDAPKILLKTNIGSKRFSEDVEIVIYRVVCELINNSLKHANCNNINVNLQLKANTIYIEYTDDGVGFSLNDENYVKGMGINNIKHRLKSKDGNINIVSDKGVKISAFVKI